MLRAVGRRTRVKMEKQVRDWAGLCHGTPISLSASRTFPPFWNFDEFCICCLGLWNLVWVLEHWWHLSNSFFFLGGGVMVLELFNHAEGSDSGGGGAPVGVIGVFSTFQEVLVSLVVGLLVEDPGTVHHHAGVDLAELEGVVNRWAVVSALRRLTSEIPLAVKPDLPRLSVHLEDSHIRELKLMKSCWVFFFLCVCVSALFDFFFVIPRLLWDHIYKCVSWLFS